MHDDAEDIDHYDVPHEKIPSYTQLLKIEEEYLKPYLRVTLYVDGPYQGTVMDAETAKPIEGAVVVAIWKHLDNNGAYRFEEIKETLTDKNGRFTLPGHARIPIGLYPGIQPPRIIIYKPGYGSFPWQQEYPTYRDRVRTPLRLLFLPRSHYDGIGLPPMKSKQERHMVLDIVNFLPKDKDIPAEKIPHFKKLIQAEKEYLGLEP